MAYSDWSMPPFVGGANFQRRRDKSTKIQNNIHRFNHIFSVMEQKKTQCFSQLKKFLGTFVTERCTRY